MADAQDGYGSFDLRKISGVPMRATARRRFWAPPLASRPMPMDAAHGAWCRALRSSLDAIWKSS